MMEAAHNEFGRIDLLVNNAAKHPPPMFNFREPDWDLWKRMAHVNIIGALVCSHHAAPYLRETNGNIVNVVMDWDARGLGYTLTKTVGTPLTRGLARELAPIRVNAVSPGAVDTWGMTDEEKEYFTGTTLLKRVGHPRDIANAIRARQRVAKLHPFVNVLHHPNVAIDLAFQGTPKRSAATATSSIAMMQRAT
jgi:meso-butanediol dehydrogenase/(S,S)-butanediol dehydrogenase/diacetyl reductase